MNEIFALEKPEHDDIETNGRIFVQPDEDDYDHDHWEDKAESHAIIQGAMFSHLCKDNQEDLCTLAPQVKRDPLTRLVESKHQLRHDRPKRSNLLEHISPPAMRRITLWTRLMLLR
jgi:thiamine phosphate synthase YjbQ (UPF0047 family)